MIKVNLIGSGRKKQAKAGANIALPKSFTPVLLILIVVGTFGGGFWWYSSLTGRETALDTETRALEARKAALDAVIKQDQIFEARRKELENRVRIVEGLQKNQVSPVIVLDQLAEAVEKTQFVWLSSLDQREAALTMNGVGTSLNAIADFYTNLLGTGYFKNIDLGPSQQTGENFTFSLKCEFSPPKPATTPAPSAGGN
jgi:Tfp pilus assembly protein PilN